MENRTASGRFDLEGRTLEFSKAVIRLCKSMPFDCINSQIIKQLLRSSTSIGANYREANEALGKKDFAFRLRISRKEAKETTYWLELLKDANPAISSDIDLLAKETLELRSILSSILSKACL